MISTDACEKAIVTLEDSCHTNAGFGSNLTWDRTGEFFSVEAELLILKFIFSGM